jgi:hypothetical protein
VAVADLLADFSLARLPRQPLVFAPEMLDELLRPTAGR